MKITMTFLGLLLATSTSFGEGIKPFSAETQDALYHLSKCVPQVQELVTPGHWIGTGQKWNSRTQNYGYNFEVFRQTGFVETEKVGTIRLTATYIPDPPADASGYDYTCVTERE